MYHFAPMVGNLTRGRLLYKRILGKWKLNLLKSIKALQIGRFCIAMPHPFNDIANHKMFGLNQFHPIV
jgi:hypothetical protein